MRLSHFFIDRPIFASVIWLITIIIGIISYGKLAVEQYPEISPPTIVVSAVYPGASADIVANTIAAPLEQEINGVEGMLYMSSQSTNSGSTAITITFKQGTDLDQAQVLVQNRVAAAEPRLPEEVRRRGINTRKNSPDMLMVVNLFSPNGTYDQTFIGNYANLQIRDSLLRIDGVGDMRLFGASDYAMRIWLDPDRVAALGLTAGDVLAALRSKNMQVASGTLGTQPVGSQDAFELNVQVQGRLTKPEEFADIIIKASNDGRVVHLRDVGRVELGAENYDTRGYLADKKAIALPIFQRPGSNALETAAEIISTMDELAKKFPKDLEYKIVYNPTEFIGKSINAVYHTIFEAIVLVVLVILLFLQNWRTAVIPVLAIPISLIGTFIVMNSLGFSLNNITLFGLVLAIGIVVDDAIVVVENMERLLAKGVKPRDAARQTMDEVGNALVAIGFVLVAVFLPTTFIQGVSGRFYQEFGVVVAVATLFSVAISLTLSPSLAALLLRAPKHDAENSNRIYSKFNAFLERFSLRYGLAVGKTVRMGGLMLTLYAGLMVLTGATFSQVPTGFIPQQDQGYFIVGIQLPPAASLERTDAVVQKVVKKLLAVDGVANAVSFAGFSGVTFSSASNAGAIFPRLESFEERAKKGLSAEKILADIRASLSTIDDAFVIVIPPPSVRGIGNGGGFKMMLQDRGGVGIDQLNGAIWAMAGAANQSGVVGSVFSFFETNTPQVFVDINREKAEKLGVPLSNIFEALGVYLGSAYVNDFNYLGRTFRVTAQADAPQRMTADDIARLHVRNTHGDMVPLGTLAGFEDRSGPARQPRYNLYPAAELQGEAVAGKSSGEAIAYMESLAQQMLPQGIGYEWTELAYQQKLASGTAGVAFGLAVVFVFLLLAALYESWILPLSIILIVPMCLFSAILGVWIAGMDNNILTQIGLVILIGLASKNAILIVEFAKEREAEGATSVDAAIAAASLRLRPILMTSFAFILGVLPLVFASGPGAEMRQALGVAVFSGMLGVTIFGLIFTPVFYVLCRKLGKFIEKKLTLGQHS